MTMKNKLVFLLISILFINEFTAITFAQSVDDINIDSNLIKITESLIKENNFLINDPSANADIHSIDVAVHIDPYKIIKNNFEDRIFIQNFGHINTPGLPMLPYKLISIALPPNSFPIRMSYKTSPSITIPGNYFIPIVTIPVCNNTFFSQHFQQIYEQNKNTILSVDTNYPREIAQFVRTSSYRNYNLVDIEIYPCSYKPLSHQLSFFSDLFLTIEYELPQGIQYASFKRDSLTTEKIAKDIIYNYNESQDWYYSYGCYNDGLYNYR